MRRLKDGGQIDDGSEPCVATVVTYGVPERYCCEARMYLAIMGRRPAVLKFCRACEPDSHIASTD